MRVIAIFAGLIMMLMMVACAPTSPISQAPEQHEVTIHVESKGDVSLDEIDTDKLIKSMEVRDTEVNLSHASFLCADQKTAYMKLFSFITDTDVIDFWNDFIYLQNKTDIKDIHFYINSGGGSAFAGLAMADEIERAINNGFNITAHASGIIASATVPILAVAKYRIASPGTIFMVHEAAMFKFLSRETASDIRAQKEMMDLMTHRYLQKLADYTNLSIEEWQEMERKTTWFDAKKALEIGLIDEIG